MFASKFFKRETRKKYEGAWKPKQLHELSADSKSIYEKMGNFLVQKKKDEEFCLSLVNADIKRDGFLHQYII